MKKQMTLKEMRAILKKEGIRGYSRMDRPTLENAIRLIKKKERAIKNRFKLGEKVWVNYNKVFIECEIVSMLPRLTATSKYGTTEIPLHKMAKGEVLTQEEFQAYKYNNPFVLYVNLEGEGTLVEGVQYYFYIPAIDEVKLATLNEIHMGNNIVKYIIKTGGFRMLATGCAKEKNSPELLDNTNNFSMEPESIPGGIGLEVEVGSGLSIAKNKEYLAEYINNGYKLVFDGSIGGGYEINTPVFQGDISSLSPLLKDVVSLGGKAKKTCGIHVHVDCTGFDARRLLNVILLYSMFSEKALKHFIPKHRWNNGYCRSYKNNKKAEYIIDDLKTSITTQISASSCKEYTYGYDRYMDVNLRSYYDHNTIEFRQFQCTLEYEEILAWVEIIKAIIDLSGKQGKARLTINKKSCTFDEMCDILNISKSSKQVLQTLHEKLKMKGELIV